VGIVRYCYVLSGIVNNIVRDWARFADVTGRLAAAHPRTRHSSGVWNIPRLSNWHHDSAKRHSPVLENPNVEGWDMLYSILRIMLLNVL
jgi:hypothetical protein